MILILGGTHKMFQNIVLRRIFGPKREEVIGKWRIFHNEGQMFYSECCQIVQKLWQNSDRHYLMTAGSLGRA
jgi:hypothetical protein